MTRMVTMGPFPRSKWFAGRRFRIPVPPGSATLDPAHWRRSCAGAGAYQAAITGHARRPSRKPIRTRSAITPR